MEVLSLVVGEMFENCYILANDKQEAIIIDPGAEAERIIKFAEPYKVVGILVTHFHFDHIGAVDYLYDKYHCPIYIHHEDIEMLTNSRLNLSYLEKPFSLSAPVTPASEHMEISGFKICWFHLPGHCPGASMIYLENDYLNIKYYENILYLQNDKIEIKMPQSMVSITGKNLEIRYYSEQEIVVCGKIESVKFI